MRLSAEQTPAFAGEKPESDEWTVARVLSFATDDFRRRGLDSPRLDAELLLAHALRIDRIRLFIETTRVLDRRELAEYRGLIQRRRQREPVAYILGVREFHGLPLRVDRRVLVPRPDTETLVEVALERTRAWRLYGEALDLCTGSGCVAIALARRRPTWRVTGVDVSSDAVAVAQHNAERLGAVWGVGFAVSDLDGALARDQTYDLVTANPPYIPTADLATLPPDVKSHEPHLALDGGPDGLLVLRGVISAARRRLRPGGTVALEVGHDQADRVAAIVAASGFADIARHRDYGGIERVVSGRLDP